MPRSSSTPSSPYHARRAARRTALLADRSRGMAHAPTATEAELWRCLRGAQLGVRFVRQAVIGDLIVDFLARKAALVVEVDGDVLHAHQAAADARRDEKLRRAGYRVLRIPASLVERDYPAAVEMVRCALEAG